MDRVCSAAHRQKIREIAIEREATIRRKVSIGGVVYPNLTRAAIATGFSQRTIRRVAEHGIKDTIRFRWSPEQMAALKSIRYV